jgi:crotonobetainyl-CoA:carnitine CoA-transferase CaiB-like acyl-CoA transferase
VGAAPTAEESAALGAQLHKGLMEWIGDRSSSEALSGLAEKGVVASRVYSAADIFEDETYAERQNIVQAEDDELGTIRMQATIPKLRNHAGSVWRVGPALGLDNDLVYGEYLGLGPEERQGLHERGVI